MTRQPLPFKAVLRSNGKPYPEHFTRALFFDPTPVFERVGEKLDRYKRIQPLKSTDETFPRIHNICACGCGKAIKSNGVRKFHSKGCADFSYWVHAVIVGYANHFSRLIYAYYGECCSKCEETRGLNIDHIIPVKHGGGACWLSNLIPLCEKCHRDKTNQDFGWANYKIRQPGQLTLF